MAKNPNTWSYSRFAVYDMCPLQYKLKFIDKIPEPHSPAMARGNEIHLKAARFLQRAPGYEDVPEECSNLTTSMIELRDLDPIVEKKWAFDTKWKPTKYFADNVSLRSILDAGVVYEDNTMDIIDHKTGRKYATNQDQMELFALTAMCQYPKVTAITTRLWYHDVADRNDNQVIDEFDAKDRPKLQDKWERKVAPMFVDDIFAPRPNDKCRWCSFNADNGGQCRFS